MKAQMAAIKIGIGVPSIGRFPPYLAQAAGLFEREGLKVEIQTSLPATRRSARRTHHH
jgi:ABC-type nitrate/sulfonate/bicarbonate transport system substrate-binding protein